MAGEERQDSSGLGIPGLPKTWSVAVQLIGTFGLAVFLVLYYVLVLQPRESEQYEQLRQSVLSLSEIVGGEESLLQREQASNLEELYAMAMAHEVTGLVVRALKDSSSADVLARSIEDRMILETRLLGGLRREDEGVISEMLTHKIRNSEVSERIASVAVDEWRYASSEEISSGVRALLYDAIRRAAMAK